jgi:hypothetical protein
MKPLHFSAVSAKRILSMLSLLCMLSAPAQKVKKPGIPQTAVPINQHAVTADTLPHMKAKARFDDRKVDSVVSLDSYLQMKADCEVVKTLDRDGSILIRYPDGFTKKYYYGLVVEVITPDGIRHVPKRRPYIPHTRIAIIRIPPPVPPASDPLYKWLWQFNSDLEIDIRGSIGGGQARWNEFIADENDACGDNIYKQIQFRTSFLENFGKAH